LTLFERTIESFATIHTVFMPPHSQPPSLSSRYALDAVQKVAGGLMAVLVLLTFVSVNMHALLWQSSAWLVGTVLPAVVVELTNVERDSLDLPALVRNPTLDAAATAKAKHMAANGYFAHFAPDGTTPWVFFDEAGYRYAHAGENLAVHFSDSGEVVEAWMKSPTHRANIAGGQFTEIGVGTAKGRLDGFPTVFVVQLFGTPAALPATNVTQISPMPVVGVTATSATSTAQVRTTTPTSTALVLAATTPVVETESVPRQARPQRHASTIARAPHATTTGVERTTPKPVDVPVPSHVAPPDSFLATSSGLTVATTNQPTLPVVNRTPLAIAHVATKPHQLISIAYILLGSVVIALLFGSLVYEVRRRRLIQIAYSCSMVVLMGALWWLHVWLTSGAVVA
jgi:hypothetical protein